MFSIHPGEAGTSAPDAAILRLSRTHLRHSAAAMAIAVCPPLVCAWLAQRSGNWGLFERSGNIVTALGLLSVSGRYIRHGVIELATVHVKNRQDIRFAEVWQEILTAKLGLAFFAFGTFISGWGRYLGWWSFCFVLVWAVFAVAAAHRDAVEIRNLKAGPAVAGQKALALVVLVALGLGFADASVQAQTYRAPAYNYYQNNWMR
jgi:hypothetical protein